MCEAGEGADDRVGCLMLMEVESSSEEERVCDVL